MTSTFLQPARGFVPGLAANLIAYNAAVERADAAVAAVAAADASPSELAGVQRAALDARLVRLRTVALGVTSDDVLGVRFAICVYSWAAHNAALIGAAGIDGLCETLHGPQEVARAA